MTEERGDRITVSSLVVVSVVFIDRLSSCAFIPPKWIKSSLNYASYKKRGWNRYK